MQTAAGCWSSPSSGSFWFAVALPTLPSIPYQNLTSRLAGRPALHRHAAQLSPGATALRSVRAVLRALRHVALAAARPRWAACTASRPSQRPSCASSSRCCKSSRTRTSSWSSSRTMTSNTCACWVRCPASCLCCLSLCFLARCCALAGLCATVHTLQLLIAGMLARCGLQLPAPPRAAHPSMQAEGTPTPLHNPRRTLPCPASRRLLHAPGGAPAGRVSIPGAALQRL